VSATQLLLARFLESATWKGDHEIAIQKHPEMARFSEQMCYRPNGVLLGNELGNNVKDGDTMNK
jgi:hypothetical protein